MKLYNLNPVSRGRKVLIFFIVSGILIVGLSLFGLILQKTNGNLVSGGFANLLKEGQLVILEGNTLFPISDPSKPEPKVIRKLPVVVTAYSSSPLETDNTPYITAAGTWVRDGVVANNYLPIGTKIKIPELFGDKIFIVEDRMSWKKGNYHIDVWLPSYWEAKNFGAKKTYIEILEG